MQVLVQEPVAIGITHYDAAPESALDVLRSVLIGKVICMEGLIAAGKTEFVKNCRNFLVRLGIPCEIISEDVDEFLLERFNRQPATYATLFQQRMMTSRLISAVKAKECSEKREGVVLLDTGVMREIAFSTANRTRKNIDEESYQAHMKCFTSAFESIGCPLPDVIILLNCSVDRAMSNMKKRNRSNEALISEDYMESIRSHYLSAAEHDLIRGKTKVITLDVSDSYAPLTVLDSMVRALKE